MNRTHLKQAPRGLCSRSKRGTIAERSEVVPERNAERNDSAQTRTGYSFPAERLVERGRNVPSTRSNLLLEGGTVERRGRFS
jgi:hypothetical protein